MMTAVVGGGAAGYFAAIHLAENGAGDVLILERGRSVLEKVRVSGGGRCNVTHACWDPRELIKHYPRGGQELLGPFHKFACGDTMAWFEERGVPLKIEEDGRVFPRSDDSQSIIDCLQREAKRLGVRVITGVRVTAMEPPAPRRPNWKLRAGDGDVHADRLVVTSGSNPAVWKLLAGLGHRIIAPVPSLFAFNVPDAELRQLAGITLPWSTITVPGRKLVADGPLLITHKGISGPAVLRLSAWGARDLHPLTYNFGFEVNWVAGRKEDVLADLKDLREERSRQRVATRSGADFPLRLWQYLLSRAGIPSDTQWAQVSNQQLDHLAVQMTAAAYRVTGKATNKEEFTTAGGVALAEVDFRTFASKIHPELYLAGEVLDVDAVTGGFNFQAAWTGGYLIGRGASAT